MVSHEIVPARLAVKAMRDSGYKNAAYAIAELIDNSLQAGASCVQLLCAESEQVVNARRRTQIKQLAVLDDGRGMSAVDLRRALQFGNGSYLDDRSGIGRFGMGLPNSSLSQARRVDVWTWGPGRPVLHSYLDLDEIIAGRQMEVPLPQESQVPVLWRSAAGGVANSGTLVVWSNLDRCQWRTARAVIENSEYLIGRIYRRFISKGLASIRMAAFEIERPGQYSIDRLAQANDPMYLMSGTSCPAPWNETPMFQSWGEPVVVPVRLGGVSHGVKLKFAIAKRPAREGHNPGSRDHGQHAARNIGVSVMRADRELELQLGWITKHDPRERWWGAEVEFPAALDEIFGVTNDKQSARALSDVAGIPTDELAEREGFSSVHELESEWAQTEDPRLCLLKVKIYLDSNLNQIREELREQTARSGRRPRHPDSAESKGTEATRQRQSDGHVGGSDEGEAQPDDVRKEAIETELLSVGLDAVEAQERATQLLQDRRKYEFVHSALDTDAFFSVRPRGGALLITLNTEHPAYEHLIALLEGDPDLSDLQAIRQRMRQTYEGLKLLIEAWARYEDELPESQRDRARDARRDWGRVARQFLAQD